MSTELGVKKKKRGGNIVYSRVTTFRGVSLKNDRSNIILQKILPKNTRDTTTSSIPCKIFFYFLIDSVDIIFLLNTRSYLLNNLPILILNL